YRPTGPAPVRRRDAVRLIGEAVGRPVRFVELSPEQARELWRDVYPPQVVEWFLEMGRYPNGARTTRRARIDGAHSRVLAMNSPGNRWVHPMPDDSIARWNARCQDSSGSSSARPGSS
ncbi:hypothetical protein K7G98_36930, partial [Saccharothrix sp. MB29]|nr:hypothetical protein [Saccharothrix sp. MB29]